MMDIREKLYSLIDESGACFNCFPCEGYDKEEKYKIADYLITNGVTVSEEVEELKADNQRLREMWAKAVSELSKASAVQEAAYWKDVMDCGVGNCFGICSNCLTQQKAASYASLMTEYRHCRWCGARMVYQPPKGE